MLSPRIALMTLLVLVVPLATSAPAPARTKTAVTHISVYDSIVATTYMTLVTLPASSSRLTLSEKIQVFTTTLLVPHTPASATPLPSPSTPDLSSAAENPILTTTLLIPAPATTIILSPPTPPLNAPQNEKKTHTLIQHITPTSPPRTVTTITDIDVLDAPAPTLAPSESEKRCFPLGTAICDDTGILITTTHDLRAEMAMSDFIQAGGVTGTSHLELYGTSTVMVTMGTESESARVDPTPFVEPTTTRYFDLESGGFVDRLGGAIGTLTTSKRWVDS